MIRARYLCPKCPWVGSRKSKGGNCPLCGGPAEDLTTRGQERRSKYRAKATEVDGVLFASKKEAKRYTQLRALERHGHIAGLELQPRFPLVVNGVKVCEYRGDFRYVQEGAVVVEDVKGFKTREYRLKKRLLLAVHGVEVLET